MESKRPVVVIVGAGFGGLAAVKALEKEAVDLILVDQHNHHLFQPLLYQVATAWLSPADIAAPVRNVFSRQKNLSVVLGTVVAVEAAANNLTIDNGMHVYEQAYDYLVLATGARHDYFGNDQWEAFAPGLKTLDDAIGIRERLLLAFERAEMATDPEERDAHLTIVIVGAGATGVEMAGSIVELARAALVKDFRRIDPRQARVLLVEAGPRVLPAFPEHLSVAAKRSLEKLGVQVKVNSRVTKCEAGSVTIGERRVPAETVIWAAGVKASPAAAWLGAEADRAGRVKVAPDYSVPNHSNVFVIGDTASLVDADERLCPASRRPPSRSGADPGGVTAATAWQGGGGFRYLRLAPSLMMRDADEQWVVSPDYNAPMLVEAVCKHEGFRYQPSETVYWQQGRSTEQDFLYVTTQMLTPEHLERLSAEVGPDRHLLVYCAAFACAPDRWPNLTLRKMPNALLDRCEWGRDDYSLKVAALPEGPAPADAASTASAPADKPATGRGRKKKPDAPKAQPGLFGSPSTEPEESP